MPTCPEGHESADTDYCDTCGLALTRGSQPAANPAPSAGSPSREPASDLTCAGCGEPREGRFCEVCGFDNDLPGALPANPPVQAPAPTAPSTPETPAGRPPDSWTAVVRADREWFEQVRSRKGPDAEELEFPAYCPERRFELTGSRLTIGRYSRSRGTNPDIDLNGPPIDPGVSAQHALLLARSGGWELVDLESTNGTVIGDSDKPITAHVPVSLRGGDRIKLGAWTTITIEAG